MRVGGSKATAAAKLVAQATGLGDAVSEMDKESAWSQLTMDKDGAARLLAMVQAERKRRAETEDE